MDAAWYSRVLRRSTLSNVLIGVKTFEMVTVILSSLDGPRKDRSVGWSECVHQRAFLDMGNHDQHTQRQQLSAHIRRHSLEDFPEKPGERSGNHFLTAASIFYAGWSLLPVSILMVGLLHSATQRMLDKFGQCAQRTPVFHVLRKRGIQVAVLVNSPILIAVMCSLPSEAIGKQMYLMCAHSQLIVIVVGMFFGILHTVVRERCSRLRQNVEAILFSTKSLACGIGRH